MSNTPETEVLRISGNVTVPFGEFVSFEKAFKEFTRQNKDRFSFTGNIVKEPDSTGMRLYRVEEVEFYKTSLDKAEKVPGSEKEFSTSDELWDEITEVQTEFINSLFPESKSPGIELNYGIVDEFNREMKWDAQT
jgi:hypothetical protein